MVTRTMSLHENDSRLLDLAALARAVTDWIEIQPSSGLDDDLATRLDVLDRVVDVLRSQAHNTAHGLSLREFLRAGPAISGSSRRSVLEFVGPTGGAPEIDWASFSRPIALQRRLLIFLLVHGEPSQKILDTIGAFIRWNQKQLQLLDFERTKSGPPRVWTNTRFAAGDLRNHGILKYSDDEAFKVWELSFIGLVLALEVYRLDRSGRHPLPPGPLIGRGLDGEILRILKNMEREQGLNPVLRTMCKLANIDPGDAVRIHDLVIELYREYLVALEKETQPADQPADETPRVAEVAAQIETIPALHSLMEQLRAFLQSRERAAVLEAMFPLERDRTPDA